MCAPCKDYLKTMSISYPQIYHRKPKSQTWSLPTVDLYSQVGLSNTGAWRCRTHTDNPLSSEQSNVPPVFIKEIHHNQCQTTPARQQREARSILLSTVFRPQSNMQRDEDNVLQEVTRLCRVMCRVWKMGFRSNTFRSKSSVSDDVIKNTACGYRSTTKHHSLSFHVWEGITCSICLNRRQCSTLDSQTEKWLWQVARFVFKLW